MSFAVVVFRQLYLPNKQNPQNGGILQKNERKSLLAVRYGV